MARFRAMVVTDLDGTLLGSDGKLSPRNLAALALLGKQNVLRVIATGRSLYSARLVLPAGLPIDYLVFSSGAGTVHWPTQELIDTRLLAGSLATAAAHDFVDRGWDFMIHAAVPENHRFHFWSRDTAVADFERRRERYADFATRWDRSTLAGDVTQLLAVRPPHDTAVLAADYAQRWPQLRMIVATSPLDGESLWLEFFDPEVSKSLAAQRLAGRHAIARQDSFAIGNDYNDADLLAWAGHSFVVANGRASLRAHADVVPSNDDDGFAAMVGRLLQ